MDSDDVVRAIEQGLRRKGVDVCGEATQRGVTSAQSEASTRVRRDAEASLVIHETLERIEYLKMLLLSLACANSRSNALWKLAVLALAVLGAKPCCLVRW